MKKSLCILVAACFLVVGVVFAQASDGKIYTLLECAQNGIENSFKLKGYDSRVRENQAKVKETLAAENPHVGIQGATVYQKPEIDFSIAQALPISIPGLASAPAAVVQPEWYHNYSVSIRKLISSFGRIEAAAKLIGMTQEIEKTRKDMETQSLLFSVTQAFYNMTLAGELLETARAEQASWEEQYHVTEALYNRGAVARYDLLRVEVSLERSRDQVQTTIKNLGLARGNLRTLMGLPVDTFIEGVRETCLWKDEESHRLEFSLEKWRQIALQSQPAIQLARVACMQAEYALQLAMLDMAPALNFETGYTRQTATFITEDWGWKNTLSLSLPLMDGGEKKAKIAEAKEIITQADLNLSDTLRNVNWNVEQAYLELQDLHPKIDTAQHQVTVSEEGLRVAKVRYKEGLSTMVEVVDAQNSLVRARVKLSETLYYYYTSMAALSYASGILQDDIFLLGRRP